MIWKKYGVVVTCLLFGFQPNLIGMPAGKEDSQVTDEAQSPLRGGASKIHPLDDFGDGGRPEKPGWTNCQLGLITTGVSLIAVITTNLTTYGLTSHYVCANENSSEDLTNFQHFTQNSSINGTSPCTLNFTEWYNLPRENKTQEMIMDFGEKIIDCALSLPSKIAQPLVRDWLSSFLTFFNGAPEEMRNSTLLDHFVNQLNRLNLTTVVLSEPGDFDRAVRQHLANQPPISNPDPDVFFEDANGTLWWKTASMLVEEVKALKLNISAFQQIISEFPNTIQEQRDRYIDSLNALAPFIQESSQNLFQRGLQQLDQFKEGCQNLMIESCESFWGFNWTKALQSALELAFQPLGFNFSFSPSEEAWFSSSEEEMLNGSSIPEFD